MSGLYKNWPKVYKKYNIIDTQRGRRPTARQNRTQKREKYGQTQIKSPYLHGSTTYTHSRSPKPRSHRLFIAKGEWSPHLLTNECTLEINLKLVGILIRNW